MVGRNQKVPSHWRPLAKTETQLLPHKTKFKEREGFFWILCFSLVSFSHPALADPLLNLLSKFPDALGCSMLSRGQTLLLTNT